MNNNIAIIFISGAGLNSSIWDDLIKEIDFQTLTIDFPSREKGSEEISELQFEDYVNSSITQVTNWNKEKKQFILVTHSIGACVGLEVANHFENELVGFVAIGSIVPLSGGSFVSSLPFPQNLLMPIILSLFGTKPPQKAIENELCNDLTDKQTAKIVEEFTPESKALYTTRINYNFPDTKRLYIKLTDDRSMPNSLQDVMAKNFEAQKKITIESGHLPMISKTKELALVLSNFISEVVAN